MLYVSIDIILNIREQHHVNHTIRLNHYSLNNTQTPSFQGCVMQRTLFVREVNIMEAQRVTNYHLCLLYFPKATLLDILFGY